MKLSQSPIQQILLNALAGWGALFIQAPIGIFLVPFLIKRLGVDGYGIVGLLTVIVAFSEVMDLGLRASLARELSEKVAQKDVDGFRTLSSTALVLYLAVALLTISLGWIFAPHLVSFFKVSDAFRDQTIALFRVYGSSRILLSFITPVFTAGLASFTRYDLINFSDAITQIGIGIGLFVLISLLPYSSLYIWAGVVFSGLMGNMLLLCRQYRKHCFSGRLHPQYVDFKALLPLFSLSWKVYILQLTNVLAQRVDPLIISRYYYTAGVALYESGQKLVVALQPLVAVLANQLTPYTTRFHVLDQQEKQQKILFLSTRYVGILSVVFYAGLFLFANAFCRLWLFESLGEGCRTVAQIMQLSSLVCMLDATGAIHFSMLMAKRKIEFALALNIPLAIVNMLISIYIVGYTDFGITGVFIGTLISSVLRRPLYIWYIAKKTGCRVSDYLKNGYLVPVLLFLLVCPGCFLINADSVDSWFRLFAAGAVYAAYVFCILIISERKIVIDIFSKILKR